MPTLDTDLVRTPTKTAIHVGLDPVNNVLNSLHILQVADQFSGLNSYNFV